MFRSLRFKVSYAGIRAARRIRSGLETRFAEWSPDARPSSPPGTGVNGTPARVGYYLWRYPLLSETFIRREITALRNAGLRVMVLADAPGDLSDVASDASLSDDVRFLFPLSAKEVVIQTLRAALLQPITAARLLFFVFVTRYDRDKSLAVDLKIFAKASCVAARMRAAGVDHLHAPWASTNAFILLIASRLLGVPFSVQARAHDLHRSDAAFALRQKFKHARFVVASTRYTEREIRPLVSASEQSKVHCIHNGIDLSAFDATRSASPERQSIRILCVARLIEPKGLTILLQACGALRDRGVDFRCEIIGGPEEPLYTAYRVKLGVLHRQLRLENTVCFRGALPFREVMNAYRQADIFVLPCVVARNGSKDITPNALIEAMAMRLPVISTDITGIPEIVSNEETGILVASGDTNALQAAMLRLIENAELRSRLGSAARKAVEQRFDVIRSALAYAALFGVSGGGKEPASAS
jgi:glycosyltransferase involved in cell wall biosynthesis